MPIKIYIEESYEEVDWICDDIWDLSFQIDALENWLGENAKNLKPNKYVADIGFSMRADATGGGVLNSKSMQIMGEIGMDIYFSEYSSTD